MPKIYEYLGIILFFYSNDHEPIHVHGQKGEFESKAKFIIENEQIIEIQISNIKGKKSLRGTDLVNFKIFVTKYHIQIVDKWNTYFKEKKKVNFEVISKIK
jgi:hypothetical protein